MKKAKQLLDPGARKKERKMVYFLNTAYTYIHIILDQPLIID
jgi:hypothetical protein